MKSVQWKVLHDNQQVICVKVIKCILLIIAKLINLLQYPYNAQQYLCMAYLMQSVYNLLLYNTPSLEASLCRDYTLSVIV